MEKFIEKFTFYDILGYGLPGFLGLYLGYVILYPFISGLFPRYSVSNDIVFALIVLCASHITGSILSEVSYWIRAFVDKKTNAQHIKHKQNKVIRAAEERSSLIAIMTDVPEAGKDAFLTTDELQTMYADLQTDQKYNRIHNYSSVEVMCKNIATAFFLNGGLSLVYGFMIGSYKREIFSLFLVVCGVILAIRSHRFREKKETYTINWFVEKHSNVKSAIKEPDETKLNSS